MALTLSCLQSLSELTFNHLVMPSQQAGSPGALGPAAGRISLYEQRAKLLFELSRAQARAAAQSSAAAQVSPRDFCSALLESDNENKAAATL